MEKEHGPKDCHYESRGLAYSNVQIDFGEGQIKTPSELVVGTKFKSIYLGKEGSVEGKVVFTVLEEPQENEKDQWVVTVESIWMKGVEPTKRVMYLSDCNVVPYGNGLWNPANGLLKVESSS